MLVVSLCPFRVSSLVWQPRQGSWALTVVCKATYDLFPGESRLADEQEHPNEDDNHWDDDPARSVYSPNDLLPYKRRADVLLVGNAFSPRGEPVRSLVARLLVAGIDKPIEVHGARQRSADGSVREATPFTSMPLRYERAAGGPDTANPVGIRAGAATVPNLQAPGVKLLSASDAIEPIGFGPVAPAWPPRKELLVRVAEPFDARDVHRDPLPEGLDVAYFNAAPRDQQVDELRSDERLILENLHPEHRRLVTNLPGVRPRAFVERAGALPHELGLTCDTLWVDTNRSICTLVWRGQMALENAAMQGRILVAMESANERLSWADVDRLAQSARPLPTTQVMSAVAPLVAPVSERPQDDAGRPARVPTMSERPQDDAGRSVRVPSAPPPLPAALPTLNSAIAPPEGALPPELVAQLQNLEPGTDPTVASPTSERELGSDKRVAAPVVVVSPTAASPSASGSKPGAPAPKPSAPGSKPSAPGSKPSAPGSKPSAPAPKPRAQESKPGAPTPKVAPPSPLNGPGSPIAIVERPSALPDVAAPTVPGVAPPNVEDLARPTGLHAARGSQVPTVQMSSAPEPVPAIPATRQGLGGVLPAPSASVRDAVELLWFDPASTGAIRSRFKTLLYELNIEAPREMDRAPDPSHDQRPERREAFRELADRRDLARLLARAEGVTADELDDEMARAVDALGTFFAPIVLLPGVLSFSFDEVDVPERALVEQRRYPRRVVFGDTHVRGLLTPAGSRLPIVIYLPEPLASRLPMFTSLPVRVLAELHVQQDQYESCPTALRALAVGRVVSVPRAV